MINEPDNLLYNQVLCDNFTELNEVIKDFLIIHLNVRSLNANTELLKSYINSLIKLPEVIICSETWILNYPELCSIPGYKNYWRLVYSK